MRHAYFLFIWIFSVAMIGPAAAGSVTALDPAGASRVVTVIDGDTVILADRREVRLVGIQAPKLPLGRRNFKKWPLADEAKTALEKLCLDQTVTLYQGGAGMDRHGRVLAHLVRDDGLWIQGAMLRQGMARVYSFPDNRAAVAELLAEEKAARAEGAGLWTHPYYDLHDAGSVADALDTFQIVEGRVVDTARIKGRVYLNFGPNWRTDFTVSLDRKADKMFQAVGIDPLALKGRDIRVRGWVRQRNGAMIEATHPEQIEILER
ncbi:MAG: thermonuclease family protein [Magnetospiraceae bacterium]